MSNASRVPISRAVRFATLVASLAAGVPAASSAQDSFASISGTIVDSSEAVLPGARVVVIDSERGIRREVVTDGTGRFLIIGLAAGPYRFEVDLPGFEMFQEKLTLRGEDITREITLNLGTLQETVSVSRPSNDVLDTPPERYPQRPPYCGEFFQPQVAGPPPALPNGVVPVRVGGQIRTPRKVFHVRPVYPEGAGSGIVNINALIGFDGFVTQTEVTNNASPALAQAAIDAVRQWEFDPTLLNCTPVEVRMMVTVDFR